MKNPCDNYSMYNEDNGVPCYCQTRKVYSNSLKKEIPPIKPDPRLDVFISGEKKAEKEEKEGVVSFKPIGFHDVYYCLLVNEPVISMYEKGNLVCEHCHTELPNENHIFVCHINKHKIKSAEGEK